MQYFDIILFAILAGYLGIKLYRTLGIKTKIEDKMNVSSFEQVNKDNSKDNNSEKVKNENNYASGTGLDHLKELDKSFNENDFLLGANKAYEIIILAKNMGDKKQLIAMLEDDAYRSFEKEILENEMKGQHVENTKIDINNSNIIDAKVFDNVAYITTNFNVNIGTLIKSSSNSLISDTIKNPVTVENKWVFCRPLNADNPNWKLYSV